MIVKSLPDITGDGATHPFSAIPLQAKWFQVVADIGNAAVCRIGGPEASITQGTPIGSGFGGQFTPPISEETNFYDLSQINYYAPVAAVLYVLYGV